MNILLNLHEGIVKEKYFPDSIMKELMSLGTVRQNMLDRPWTEAELSDEIRGADICVTHWGSTQLTPAVVKSADSLSLVAHCAGSVFNIVCPEVYEKGIKVCSANKVMARAVAEGTLGYILASLLKLQKYTGITREGGWKAGPGEYGDMKSLFGASVLLIGFGDIARYLHDLMKPFGVRLSVYDPYLKEGVADGYPEVSFINDLDGAIPHADVISIHASRNPSSSRLMNRERIDAIKDGALLVNTARGSIMDEEYLTEALGTGRFHAALDVYEEEPLAVDHPLRRMPNVLCMPHLAGSSVVLGYAEAMIKDIRNHIGGDPLEYEISPEKAGMMTRQ